jgi:hypothetical protein
MKPKGNSSKNKAAKKPSKGKEAKSSKRPSSSIGVKPPKGLVAKASQPQGVAFGTTEPASLVDASQQTKRKATIEDWFEAVRTHMARTADSGAPTGACMVPDPNGGPSLCVEMTQESCSSPAVKGQWLGGNC